MIIDGKSLAQTITAGVKERVDAGIKKGYPTPTLGIIAVEPSAESASFIKSKENAARLAGIHIKKNVYKKSPRFIDFANDIAHFAQQESIHGIIIQQPLPASLGTMTLLDYVPDEKEIEGFKKKTGFHPPIGLAVLTMLKSVYSPEDLTEYSVAKINIDRDKVFFKSVFKRKRFVLIGRGATAGKPIGETMTEAKINFINLNSQTSVSEMFISQADIIISAVGKEIIEPKMLKKGVTLISVGMHKTKGKWKGDYDVDKINDVALAFAPTPGGVGPLNVAYLLDNLVTAWEQQCAKKES